MESSQYSSADGTRQPSPLPGFPKPEIHDVRNWPTPYKPVNLALKISSPIVYSFNKREPLAVKLAKLAWTGLVWSSSLIGLGGLGYGTYNKFKKGPQLQQTGYRPTPQPLPKFEKREEYELADPRKKFNRDVHHPQYAINRNSTASKGNK
jgi:hypothetical protein